jgi:TM2 domain-containing membrane protein YozV
MPPFQPDPAAPWGRHPITGEPYSEQNKIVAGLLQIFVPIGIGRFYMGRGGIGIAQLLVTIFTLGIGFIWSWIDGIVILAGNPRDGYGRPLRG